jgi:uridine monophosphate synthetase
MRMDFFELLTKRARQVGSLLCVGLDPRTSSSDALRSECFRLIDATAGVAAAFKPNSAFFEAHGPDGFAALRDVIAYVPEGIPVILDAKRGDIADTSASYATAAFDALGAHAITVNPYLGGDAVQPFLARAERGVFVLCKNSNPGAGEFQALSVGDGQTPLYEIVARQAAQWSHHDNVGLVVGSTDPAAIARVRAAAPNLWLLAPGVGAQGGDLAAALAAGLRPDGLGMLIAVSRSLAQAADPRREAARLRDEINHLRQMAGDGWQLAVGDQPPATHHPPPTTRLARDLVASNCVRFGQFTLKSGVVSPIYIDLRRLVAHPQILRRVAKAYAARLGALPFDRLAGIPYAALPIATAIALEMDRPLVYPRREVKEYGTRATIEGDYQAGEQIVVVDDLTTDGGSKLETIAKLEEAGLVVKDIVVLIDRMQGAGPRLAQAGYQLHAVTTLPELLDEWLRQDVISQAQFAEVTAFLQAG